jgi:hypothetical protein
LTVFGYAQIGLFLLVLLLIVKPLGGYMARVFQGQRVFLSPVIAPIERIVYRIVGIRVDEEMNWKSYAVVMLLFNLAGLLLFTSPIYLAAKSSRFFFVKSGFIFQYCYQFCNQYQLAKLQRRNYTELLYSDVWPGCSELPFSGYRNSHITCLDAGPGQALRANHR